MNGWVIVVLILCQMLAAFDGIMNNRIWMLRLSFVFAYLGALSIFLYLLERFR